MDPQYGEPSFFLSVSLLLFLRFDRENKSWTSTIVNYVRRGKVLTMYCGIGAGGTDFNGKVAKFHQWLVATVTFHFSFNFTALC